MPRTPRVPLLTALLLAALCPAASAVNNPDFPCSAVPVECCEGRPAYNDTAYAGFTGAVAVATYWSPNFSGFDSQVLVVIDAQGQGSAPLGTAGPWASPKYYGPGGSWNKGNLGTVFGLTLDPQGNIYLCASSSFYGDHYIGGASGRIWRIDASTGAWTAFNNLPNFPDPAITNPPEARPALGNISYDCDHRQFFVTNFEDGKIYRLGMTALAPPLSVYDHGVPDNGAPGFAPLGERLWGVQWHNGRVYYGVWVEDSGRPSATQSNQVWSVAIDPVTGDFVAGSSVLEIVVPAWNYNLSNPVSDISFGPAGQMLLAERSMADDTSPTAHASRVLEYVCTVDPAGGASWQPSAATFSIAEIDNPPGQAPSAAGGVDYDATVGGRVWATGDALEFNTDFVYGVQALPAAGGTFVNSILIDLNNLLDGDKTQIGDVEYPCEDVHEDSSGVCGHKYLDVNGNGVHDGGEPGLGGWTIVAQGPSGTFTAVTDATGKYCILGLPPGSYAISEVVQPGWLQTDPATVFHAVTLLPGQVVGGLDFGNREKCDNFTLVTCQAGRADDFAVADGPEPSAPDPALLGVLQACSPGQPPLLQFDEIPCRRCFGHTFDKCWSDSCIVVDARLVIRLKAGDCGPQDDTLCFMQGSTPVWCMSLNDLRNLHTGGTDPVWTVNDTMTLVLNLSALPPDANAITNILAALQDGNLGLFIGDDTGVDFARLDVRVCCPTGSIQGTKFLDVNGNGVWDAGEPPLAGWTIQAQGPVNQTAVTNGSGVFTFPNLPPGSYTVSELTQPGWVLTTPSGGTYTVPINGQNVTGLLFGNRRCGDDPCARPPAGMTGWWPLDETVPASSDDIALNNVGAWQGAPVPVPGRVGGALRFPAATSFVRVPHHPSLNVGMGPLSADAWVRLPSPSTSVKTIVDKRGGSTTNPVGWSLFVYNDRLGFQLADGTFFNWIAAGPALADNAWHHVAVTVRRNSPTGGRLYVDGNIVLVFDPTSHPGSLNTTAPLLIGQQTVLPGVAFAGDIDEVEVFRRELDSLEVRGIWQAGAAGKCRETVTLPAVVPFCGTQMTANASFTLCNNTGAPQTYQWSLAGLPAGPGCAIPGPTVFTPLSGSVNVPAGGCVTVPFTIQRPPGLGIGVTACYQVTVVNAATGRCLTSRGRVIGSPKWCWKWNGPIDVPVAVAFPGTHRLEFEAYNTADPTGHLPYRIVAVDEDGAPSPFVSLDGLPPGEPVMKKLQIPFGNSYPDFVGVDVAFPGHEPFERVHVVIEADLDGDGTFEPVASACVRSVLPEDVPAGTGDRGPAQPLSGVRVQPNPTSGAATVHFTLGRTERAEVLVFDVAGRLVRRIVAGTLEAGPHAVVWDGFDAEGQRAGHGIYLVRVRAGELERATKVVRVN